MITARRLTSAVADPPSCNSVVNYYRAAPTRRLGRLSKLTTINSKRRSPRHR
jgi:hypothetical protein